MFEDYIRKKLSRLLTRRKEIALQNQVPSPGELNRKFRNIDEAGIYLHIPFCRQICPYCPYNKELYHPETAEKYTKAVKREIDIYADIIGKTPITSIYIGGGTPTTMLYNGMEKILDHIFKVFNVVCGIHMESHPNDLSGEQLNHISELGVRHLSIGVEALQDRHLKMLKRPYTTAEVKEAVSRSVCRGFRCLNVDFIFALPGQTYREVACTGRTLLEMGVDQIAAYPLFRFPYTKMGGTADINNYMVSSIIKRRKMLRILEGIFYGAGFERTSV
ncbi:MAG: radical SAM protein, partial [Candidatus Heimdallarchaeota archaeon]|nr:radical SAM protein [Candidatus Heimdallarchaeota archaeon]